MIAWLLSALMMGRVNSQVYYTYPEWDRLSDQARTMYIAGAYDTPCQHRVCGHRVYLSALLKVRERPTDD
jgi:hypothetical protein